MSVTQNGMSRVKIHTIGLLGYDAMCSTSFEYNIGRLNDLLILKRGAVRLFAYTKKGHNLRDLLGRITYV
jgi:hypothetical protein